VWCGGADKWATLLHENLVDEFAILVTFKSPRLTSEETSNEHENTPQLRNFQQWNRMFNSIISRGVSNLIIQLNVIGLYFHFFIFLSFFDIYE
jgi:hypothetical protein